MRTAKVVGATLCGLFLLSGCDQLDSTVDKVGKTTDKADVCGEAFGLIDVNPLVNPGKLRARALDKAQRLRTLGGQVEEKDVKNALNTMADSYVEVQKEHLDDFNSVRKWVENNSTKLNALRKACF